MNSLRSVLVNSLNVVAVAGVLVIAGGTSGCSGCSDSTTGADMKIDAAKGGADLLSRDLAGVDLHVNGNVDSATPVDLAAADLPAADLASADDLSVPDDLAAPVELGPPVPDLSALGDIAGLCLPTGQFLFESNPTPYPILSFWGTGPDNLFGSSIFGDILHRDGNGWAKWTVGNNVDTLLRVWGSGSDVWATSAGGAIYHASNNGVFQAQAANVGPIELRGLWGSSANDVYVVGDNGTILHSIDKNTWTPQVSHSNDQLYGVWGSGANDVYAVGLSGTLLHTVDSGMTWTAIPMAPNVSLTGIWGSAANDIYVIGSNNAILHSTDGMTWDSQPVNVNNQSLISIWGSGPSDVWAVGGGATVLHSCGTGVWTRVAVQSQDDLWAVGGTSAANVWIAGLMHSSIMRLQ